MDPLEARKLLTGVAFTSGGGATLTEGGSAAELVVERDDGGAGAFSADLSIAGVGAHAADNSDYALSGDTDGNGHVTFADGVTVATLTLAAVTDSATESTEGLELKVGVDGTYTSTVEAQIADVNTPTVWITADDGVATEGGGNALFVIHRETGSNINSGIDVYVRFGLAGSGSHAADPEADLAAAGSNVTELTAGAAVVHLNPNQTEGTLTLSAVDDSVAEYTEGFTVAISGTPEDDHYTVPQSGDPNGRSASAEGSIVDNDSSLVDMTLTNVDDSTETGMSTDTSGPTLLLTPDVNNQTVVSVAGTLFKSGPTGPAAVFAVYTGGSKVEDVSGGATTLDWNNASDYTIKGGVDLNANGVLDVGEVTQVMQAGTNNIKSIKVTIPGGGPKATVDNNGQIRVFISAYDAANPANGNQVSTEGKRVDIVSVTPVGGAPLGGNPVVRVGQAPLAGSNPEQQDLTCGTTGAIIAGTDYIVVVKMAGKTASFIMRK